MNQTQNPTNETNQTKEAKESKSELTKEEQLKKEITKEETEKKCQEKIRSYEELIQRKDKEIQELKEKNELLLNLSIKNMKRRLEQTKTEQEK